MLRCSAIRWRYRRHETPVLACSTRIVLYKHSISDSATDAIFYDPIILRSQLAVVYQSRHPGDVHIRGTIISCDFGFIFDIDGHGNASNVLCIVPDEFAQIQKEAQMSGDTKFCV